MIAVTTLKAIRACDPCPEGWQNLLRHLGKSGADDEPLPLSVILESNGLDDALWTLRACTGIDREARLYAVECARQVQHMNTDPRVGACIDVAERFANGEATRDELAAARAAARAAAGDTVGAAAARAAARAAAAGDAAWDAAWAAAGAAAAWDAAWAAAGGAAGGATRAAQKAEFIRRFCTADETVGV